MASAAGSRAAPVPSAAAETEEEPLYAADAKVYPQRVRGRFRRIKWTALIGLLAIYYLVPWLRWDRGPGVPDQAVLLDIAGRRAYLLWIELWPQEIYYLAGLLIMAALALFLVTSVAGRVWCGFTCPQTVWTDLFMWVERAVEGDRNRRMKLDRAPLSLEKAVRKTAKHAVWLLIALLTGGAWVFYFNDAPTVVGAMVRGEASLTVYGFVGLFTATTYLLAGWAREQVCIYMCPWPRFQGAMFDEHTLLVTYEAWRGEPRGHAKAGQSFENRGHCIDCGLCVRVCPTGIDIRNGQQLACIGCGLCIDACNGVMARLGLPRDLITYDSLANQAARGGGKPPRRRLLRPRTVAYVALLAVGAAAMIAMLALRSSLELTVQPDRAPLFVTLADGSIRNAYTVKILNKAHAPRRLILEAEGLPGARLSAVGRDGKGPAIAALEVAGGSVGSFRLFLDVAREAADHAVPVTFRATDPATGLVATYESSFTGPER